VRLQSRVERSERAAGCEAGPCPLCARRMIAPPVPREFGPEWEERPQPGVEINCPRCGRPFTLILVLVGRKGEA
jgi:hypothetical protein